MIIITPQENKRQVDILLDHMIVHGSVTGMECINELGVMNYKGRICDLRKMGYTIKTKWETRINAKGQKKTYARYVLMGGKNGLSD